MQTSNFVAEYGQVGGGYFNFIMKSGTHQLHGDGFDYLGNEALNARLPWTDAAAQSPAQVGQHLNPASVAASANGVNTGGYGYIATVAGAGATLRSGQIIGRFTF